MERRNKGRSKKGRIEESSFVKAAAWAWYQHGSAESSHESRAMMQEYHNVSSRNTRSVARPSRYKLEAMKQQVQENSKLSHSSCLVHVYDDGGGNDPKSLLDSYEIDRISRDLDCYMEATHAKNCQKISCPYKTLSSSTIPASHVRRKTDSFDASSKNKGKVLSQGGNGTENEMKIKQKDRKPPRGFGFIVKRSTMICSARLDDVVDVRVKVGGSRWPEKHVAVVNVATCRPRRI